MGLSYSDFNPTLVNLKKEGKLPLDYVIQNTLIFHWYFNSVVSGAAVTLGTLVLSMMCAYPISQIRFKVRGLIYVLILAGFMIPTAVVTVIIYKQFFEQIPGALSDAAKMDAAGHFRILFSLFLPLNWGITWAMVIIVFIAAWNNFFWPFIIISSNELLTIPVGITQVQSWYGVAYAKLMASAVLAAIPTVVLYVVFHRKVAQGVAITSGIK